MNTIMKFALGIVLIFSLWRVGDYFYREHHFVELNLFNDKVGMAVTADNKFHIRVEATPRDVVEGTKFVLFPKIYMMEQGLTYLKEHSAEEIKEHAISLKDKAVDAIKKKLT